VPGSGSEGSLLVGLLFAAVGAYWVLGALGSRTPSVVRALKKPVRAGTATIILVGYGLVPASVGLLVQAVAISASAHADRPALARHACLWDPWFLMWGLLVDVAGHRGRPRHIQAALHSWPD
jgi:hypothetical protein